VQHTYNQSTIMLFYLFIFKSLVRHGPMKCHRLSIRATVNTENNRDIQLPREAD